MKAVRRDRLWVITTYFNPVGYRKRLENYHIFRRHLAAPLLTVELSHNGQFELEPEDADHLVQVHGTDVMWQKERLLNVAVAALPASSEFVAWIDCDAVFREPDWMGSTTRLLETCSLVQLFKELYDLPEEATVDEFDAERIEPTALSVAYKVQASLDTQDDFHPPQSRRLRKCAFGLGWAARREILDRHGFYDAFILGSGDRAMACAAFGNFNAAVETALLNRRRAEHYLAWARPYFEAVKGRVGCVGGEVLHLWHGDVKNRKYLERHKDLSAFDFDPFGDLRVDEQGSWRWNSSKPELHEYVRAYFQQRKEDGASR